MRKRKGNQAFGRNRFGPSRRGGQGRGPENRNPACASTPVYRRGGAAESWHRKYTYAFAKQCGVDFPPLGKDLRWYTSRLSALKHGRRAQRSTLAGAVEVGPGKWRPVLGGRVASGSSPFSALGISVHISPSPRPEGSKVPHN